MIEKQFLTIKDLAVGQIFTSEIYVNSNDAVAFLNLTGDFNPLHRDQSFTRQTTLKRVNLAGQQVTSLCVGLIGTHMPGPGWSCLSVNAKYVKPAYECTTYRVTIECLSLSTAVGVATWSIEVNDTELDLCISRITVVTQRIL